MLCSAEPCAPGILQTQLSLLFLYEALSDYSSPQSAGLGRNFRPRLSFPLREGMVPKRNTACPRHTAGPFSDKAVDPNQEAPEVCLVCAATQPCARDVCSFLPACPSLTGSRHTVLVLSPKLVLPTWREPEGAELHRFPLTRLLLPLTNEGPGSFQVPLLLSLFHHSVRGPSGWDMYLPCSRYRFISGGPPRPHLWGVHLPLFPLSGNHSCCRLTRTLLGREAPRQG